MPVGVCANANCKRGPGRTRNTVENRLYCSRPCAVFTRNRRAYQRRKRGVVMRTCEQCGGIGKIETRANTGEPKTKA